MTAQQTAQFDLLSGFRRATPFIPGDSVRGYFGRALSASRRRPANLPPCQNVTVTFPSDIGQPANPPTTLTAAVVDPSSTVTGEVNATGCDVGVALDSNSAGARIVDAQIHDANQFGILGVSSKNTLIVNSTIFRIGWHDATGFDPNGVQTGVGIDFEHGSAQISGAFITQYQKNGTAFDFGSNVSIANSCVIGLGTVNYIAQNGVQWYESIVRGAAHTLATANHYNNPSDTLYNGQATGFLVLCTNLKFVTTNTILTDYDYFFDNDIPTYISNNEPTATNPNADCPTGYQSNL